MRLLRRHTTIFLRIFRNTLNKSKKDDEQKIYVLQPKQRNSPSARAAAQRATEKACLFILVLVSSFSLAAQDGYRVKGDTVLYAGYIMTDVDAKTFKAIDTNYGVDSRNAYFQFEQIKGADAATFKVLNYNFSCDKQHVFCKEDIVKGADVATFRLIDDNYACDRSNIYYREKKLEDADKETFRPMKIGQQDYACDREHVYWRGRKLKDIDIKTFRTLSDDAQNIEVVFFNSFGKEFPLTFAFSNEQGETEED